MNRREFLRRASLIAAGIVAADQLEILERLTHRKVFASPFPNSLGRVDLLDWRGRVVRSLPWNGEQFHTMKNHGIADHQWARVIVDPAHNDKLRARAFARLGLPAGGEKFTIPWGLS